MTVGVLALQGDFQEHLDVLQKLGVNAVRVKLPSDLRSIDRLIIPGGESTTIGKLLVLYKLLGPIRQRVKKGMPVWGTCAGAILLAKRIACHKPGQASLALMDITAHRNAFGRQLDSFETDVSLPSVDREPLHVAFIRAPILENPGKNVSVLGSLPGMGIVAAQEGRMLATCFHPEITGSESLHRYFLTI